jgi:hypothetical protein
MRKLPIALLIFAMPSMAFAEEPKKENIKSKELTVSQVIGIGSALRALAHPYLTQDKSGNQISLTYKFSGDALMTMASDLQVSDSVSNNFQKSYRQLVNQTFGAIDPKTIDGMPMDSKKAKFLEDLEKMVNSNASVNLLHINKKDLCLDAKNDCDSANPIPVDVLSLLEPIIDR